MLIGRSQAMCRWARNLHIRICTSLPVGRAWQPSSASLWTLRLKNSLLFFLDRDPLRGALSCLHCDPRVAGQQLRLETLASSRKMVFMGIAKKSLATKLRRSLLEISHTAVKNASELLDS